METNKLINLAGELDYNPEKFSQKILFQNEHQKVILFTFSRNQELKTHTTSVRALLIMLEGSCMLEMEDNITRLAAGEVIEIPAQIPHNLKAASNFKMLLIK